MTPAKNKTTVAYSYIRFSTPDQAKGYSEARQTDSTTEFASKHGWQLDNRLKLFDAGRSAFKAGFQKKLLGFIRAIEDKSVRPGSVLIVEQLDRLTRQNQTDALNLFLQIVNAGVSIATIHPERVYDKKSLNDGFGLIEVIVSLKLANEESEKKQWRATDNWARSRAKARQNKTPSGGRCPSWLRIESGKLVIDKPKAEIVRKMFRLAIDKGWGAKRIANHFNTSGVENIAKGNTGRKATWNSVYIHGVLNSVAVLGTYQPCRKIDGKLVPDGEPIEGYYPQVIDRETYYAAQAANSRRKTAGGNPGKQSPNLFTGLLYDARTKAPLRVKSKVLNSWHEAAGPSWHYDNFESGFLAFLTEVSFAAAQAEGVDISALAGELGETKEKIAKLEARILGGAEFDTLIQLLEKLSTKKSELERAIEQAKAEASRETSTVADLTSIAERLAAAKPEAKTALRDQLRAKIRLAIDSVWMLIEEYQGPHNKTKIATVQVFVGDESRIFCLVKKLSKWFYFPLQGRSRYKLDLREWTGKPLYQTDAGGVKFPFDGFE